MSFICIRMNDHFHINLRTYTPFKTEQGRGLGRLRHSWLATTWQGGHVGGKYNSIFSQRIYMKVEFSSQRREMLFFLTLTHHQHGRRDVTCTWFPLPSRPSMNVYISKLAYYRSPCALIHLISCTLLRQLLKQVLNGNRKFRGCTFSKVQWSIVAPENSSLRNYHSSALCFTLTHTFSRFMF